VKQFVSVSTTVFQSTPQIYMHDKPPLVRTLVTLIAKYLDWLGPSGKFVENSTKF
jgi:hypothetical protein